MENQVEQVKAKKYELISIQDWANIFRFVVFLASLALVYYGFKTVLYFWKELGIGLDEKVISPLRLVILPWFFVEYGLTALAAICFTAWLKKGFKNLKSYKEVGLIRRFIPWLIAGFIWLIAGFISTWYLPGFFRVFIMGAIAGLIGGFILGFIWGLKDELS